MTAGDPILEVRGLRVSRGGAAILEIPALAVSPGETLCLIGPNGAGKSTLLLGLCGIDPPTAGVLLFRGERVPAGASSLAYRRRTALVFQEPLLFNTTVFENVASGLKIRGLAAEKVRRQVGESLERFRIAHLADRAARTLSGGEAQRTSLARAMAVAPEILLLDEPFAALDPPTREGLLADLERTLRETRTTTVFATHDRNEARRLADRVVVLHEGRVRQVGSVDEVMRRPADPFVAAFVGVENILPGRLQRRAPDGGLVGDFCGREVFLAGNGSGVSAGEKAYLCIRPEDVILAAPGTTPTGDTPNVFAGTVIAVVPEGPFRKVVLDCGCRICAAVSGHVVEELSLREGSAVTLSFRPADLHLIRKG